VRIAATLVTFLALGLACAGPTHAPAKHAKAQKHTQNEVVKHLKPECDDGRCRDTYVYYDSGSWWYYNAWYTSPSSPTSASYSTSTSVTSPTSAAAPTPSTAGQVSLVPTSGNVSLAPAQSGAVSLPQGGSWVKGEAPDNDDVAEEVTVTVTETANGVPTDDSQGEEANGEGEESDGEGSSGDNDAGGASGSSGDAAGADAGGGGGDGGGGDGGGGD
jgi:hypothetical protein